MAAIAAGVVGGCKKTGEERDNASAVTPKQVEVKEPSRRSSLVTHRALLDEVVRAELDAGGLLIDFGVPEQHKYTRGGWRTGWGKTGKDGEVTWLAQTSRRGFLELAAPRTVPTEIQLRARSRAAGQRLTLYVGEKALGTAELGTEWSVARVAVPADALPRTGRFRFELRASEKGVDDVRAEIDWLWFAADPGEPALGPRVLPLAIEGTARRSLAAPTSRTYAFYVQPPPGAELVVDLGATERAEFVVRAITDGAEPSELLRETVEGRWTERAISLASLAGRAVRLELETTRQKGAVGWGEPELMIAPRAAPAPAGTPPKNVILLVMDTMRADAFAAYGGPDRVAKTPVFDAFARRSTVFTSAYDNENWTKPSVATTLSGLYPSTHGAKKDESKLSDDVELLSERLQREGFATAGFVANGYVSDKFGFEQGWDSFKNYIRESKPSEAEHVFSDALAWHEAHTKRSPDQPFFLYVQTIDPHVVYRVDKEYYGMYFDGDYRGPLGSAIEAEDQVALSSKKLKATERDLAWLRALYWGEVSYHDAQLGTFLEALEARGAFENTMLVITNDHGEELGERGRFGHGHQVFEEMIRAPLLVHYPALFPAGAEISDIVEHVDLAPTILDALGREPLKEADGYSFLPLVRGQPVRQPAYAMVEFLDGRRVLRVGNWKLFARAGATGALFDVAADPKEEKELGDAAPIAAGLAEVHLGEALATPDKARRLEGVAARRQFQAGAADISPEMRRQLEALGYFGAGPKPVDPETADDRN